MSAALRTLRSISTRTLRPTNWRTSPFDSPQALTAPISRSPASSTRSNGGAPQLSRDPTPSEHIKHRLALKRAFPGGWSPPRKLSRDAMDGLRTLHSHSPETFTTSVLAERFKISPEAVRRILRSRWVPDKERKAELRIRDETKRAAWKRGRVQKEWDEGVHRGALKVVKKQVQDNLMLT